MANCERCNKRAPAGFKLFDYCASCQKNLCDDCAAQGCCGVVPMASGLKADDICEHCGGIDCGGDCVDEEPEE